MGIPVAVENSTLKRKRETTTPDKESRKKMIPEQNGSTQIDSEHRAELIANDEIRILTLQV